MPLTKHLRFRVTFCIAVLAAAPGAYAQPTNPETTPWSDFQGTIGRTADDSEPALLPPAQPRPDSPNIIYIVLDDTGFSDLASYGSRVNTPHMDTLAGLCCVLCAKALEQKERSWHKVACRSRPTHKGVTP